MKILFSALLEKLNNELSDSPTLFKLKSQLDIVEFVFNSYQLSTNSSEYLTIDYYSDDVPLFSCEKDFEVDLSIFEDSIKNDLCDYFSNNYNAKIKVLTEVIKDYEQKKEELIERFTVNSEKFQQKYTKLLSTATTKNWICAILLQGQREFTAINHDFNYFINMYDEWILSNRSKLTALTNTLTD